MAVEAGAASPRLRIRQSCSWYPGTQISHDIREMIGKLNARVKFARSWKGETVEVDEISSFSDMHTCNDPS